MFKIYFYVYFCMLACIYVYACMYVHDMDAGALGGRSGCQIPVTGVTDGFESDADAVTAEPPFQLLVVQVLMTLSCSHPQMFPGALHLSQSSALLLLSDELERETGLLK